MNSNKQIAFHLVSAFQKWKSQWTTKETGTLDIPGNLTFEGCFLMGGRVGADLMLREVLRILRSDEAVDTDLSIEDIVGPPYWADFVEERLK